MTRAVSKELAYEQPMTARQPASMEAAGAALAMARVSSWMRSAGTSQIFSAQEGVYCLTSAANSSKPVVFCSTNSWSYRSSSMSTFAMPSKSAMSVPGVMGTQSSAKMPLLLRRGSTMTTRVPDSAAEARLCTDEGRMPSP